MHLGLALIEAFCLFNVNFHNPLMVVSRASYVVAAAAAVAAAVAAAAAAAQVASLVYC